MRIMRTKDICITCLALCLAHNSHSVNGSYWYRRYIRMYYFIPDPLPRRIFSACISELHSIKIKKQDQVQFQLKSEITIRPERRQICRP